MNIVFFKGETMSRNKYKGVNSRKKKSSTSQVIEVESPFRRFRRFGRGLARTFPITKLNPFVF
jgi:hypothetical protein